MDVFKMISSAAVWHGGAPIVDFRKCLIGDILDAGLVVDLSGRCYVSEEHL